MNRYSLIECWKADLFRYKGKITISAFLDAITRIPGFQFSFSMRLYTFLIYRKTPFILRFLVSRIYVHYRYKYGIEIPPSVDIGSGLYIPHCGNIVVHNQAVIGCNCTISNGVTLGYSARGQNKGVPQIGDNVYISPGAKVLGNIVICDNSIIGANSVVLNDMPENAVIVGIPAKTISLKGAGDYNVNLWNPK